MFAIYIKTNTLCIFLHSVIARKLKITMCYGSKKESDHGAKHIGKWNHFCSSGVLDPSSQGCSACVCLGE